MKPLVSVICLCYNHARFVTEAVESVMAQSYAELELIIVDDASNDNSTEVIQRLLTKYPTAQFIRLTVNHGNCRAFNIGFASAQGEFIIDLAADDILKPDRVTKGVDALLARDETWGVQFGDAELISEDGKSIGLHSDKHPHETIPQGDVYLDLVGRYFINSPTMMMRRKVLVTLGGYDETLAYEDFDFWIRASRYFKFCYVPEPLIRRRIVGTSMSRQQYKRNSAQLRSTYKVVLKVKSLNRTPEENKVLKKRARYEMRKALAVGEFRLAWNYIKLCF